MIVGFLFEIYELVLEHKQINTKLFFMKSKLSLLGLFLFLVQVHAQTPHLEWLVQFGQEYSTPHPSLMSTDSEGNVISYGSYHIPFDADPSDNSFILDTISGESNYIQKLDKEGNFLWAMRIKGGGYTIFPEMTLDQEGNIILAGRINEQIDFYFDSGVETLVGNDNSSVNQYFFLKISKDGDLLWLKRLDGTGNVGGINMVVDNQSNVYINGSFAEEVSLADTMLSLTSDNQFFLSTFFLKFSSEGDPLFFEAVQGESGGATVKSMIIDPSGDLFLHGTVYDSVDLDPGDGEYYLSSELDQLEYLLKMDGTSMDVIWAKSKKGRNINSITKMVYGEENGIYLEYSLEESEDLDYGDETLMFSPNSTKDRVLVKYDSEGNYEWAMQSGGGLMADGKVSAAAGGGVFWAGNFEGEITLNYGADSIEMSSSNTDIYLLQVSKDGGEIWSRQLGGNYTDLLRCISSTSDEELFLSGTFSSSCDFGLGQESQIYSSQQGRTFVQKIQIKEDLNSLEKSLNKKEDLLVYPNPNQGHFNLSLDKEMRNVSVTLFDSRGIALQQFDFDRLKEASLSIDGPAGVYIIVLESEEGVMQRRIKKIK